MDWAHESAWRFLPLVAMADGGVMLHPIDLAINKLVALANRREPRDLVDAIFADTHILAFPALVWAVVDKNPGLNPSSYLEQFRRRTLTPEDAAYLTFTGARVPFSFHNPTTTGPIRVRIAAPWAVSLRNRPTRRSVRPALSHPNRQGATGFVSVLIA